MSYSVRYHVAGTTSLDMLFYQSCQLIPTFLSNTRGADRTYPHRGTHKQMIIVTATNFRHILDTYGFFYWNNPTHTGAHPKHRFPVRFSAATQYRYCTILQSKLPKTSSFFIVNRSFRPTWGILLFLTIVFPPRFKSTLTKTLSPTVFANHGSFRKRTKGLAPTPTFPIPSTRSITHNGTTTRTLLFHTRTLDNTQYILTVRYFTIPKHTTPYKETQALGETQSQKH